MLSLTQKFLGKYYSQLKKVMNVLNKIKTKQNKGLNNDQNKISIQKDSVQNPGQQNRKLDRQDLNKETYLISNHKISDQSKEKTSNRQIRNHNKLVSSKLNNFLQNKSHLKSNQSPSLQIDSKNILEPEIPFQVYFNADPHELSNQKQQRNIFKSEKSKSHLLSQSTNKKIPNNVSQNFYFETNSKQENLSKCVCFKVRRGSQVADMSVFIGHFVQSFNTSIYNQKVDPKVRNQKQIALSTQFCYQAKPHKIKSIYLNDFFMIQDDQGIFSEENVIKFAEN